MSGIRIVEVNRNTITRELSSNESELSLENVDDFFTDCGEMGHQDICAVLKISDTNLWVRLHRARMLLRRRLEARWFGKKADKG